MSADNIHAEAGLPGHRILFQRYMPGFRTNDPFSPSIVQSIRNRRMSSNIRDMDDVGLPDRPHFSGQYHHGLRTQQAPTNVPALQSTHGPGTYHAYGHPQGHHAYPAAQYSPLQAQPIIQQPTHFLSQFPPYYPPPQPSSYIPLTRHGRSRRSRSPSPSRRLNSSVSFHRRDNSRSRSPVRISARHSPRRGRSRSPRYHSPERHTRYADDDFQGSSLDQHRTSPISSRHSSARANHRAESPRYSPTPSPAVTPAIRISRPLRPGPHETSLTEESILMPETIPLPSLDSSESMVPTGSSQAHVDESLRDTHKAKVQPTSPKAPNPVSRPDTPPDSYIPSPSRPHPTGPSTRPLRFGSHFIPSQASPSTEKVDYDSTFSYPHPSTIYLPENRPVLMWDYIVAFITDALPRQIYLHFLLRLPSLYFSRVKRIFQETDLTIEEIKEMALQATAEDNKTFQYNMLNIGHYYYHSEATNLSPAYRRLKDGWEHFIDSLMREWKTLNIISVLLLSAIMTMFQIQGAAEDPITRYIAFWSLICALMSLLYGCLFIIRFGTMRKASKAAEWALEARKTQTIFWNVWVMLAMPVIWLSWSILTFIACIMSFMWRVGANLPSEFVFSAPTLTEFAFRVFICGVLGIGVLYGALVINTFRRYGAQMDEAWTRRVQSFIGVEDHRVTMLPPPLPHYFPRSSRVAPEVMVISPTARPGSPVAMATGSRRSSESNGDYDPYLAAVGTRSLGKSAKPASTPPRDITLRSRSSSPTRKVHWHRRSKRNDHSRRSSRSIVHSPRARSHHSRSPEPHTHRALSQPSLLAQPESPSLSYKNPLPQRRMEERRSSSRSHSLYSRRTSLDGGSPPLPPLKITDEPLYVATIAVAKEEPEKLPLGNKKASNVGFIEPRLHISENEGNLLEDGEHPGFKR